MLKISLLSGFGIKAFYLMQSDWKFSDAASENTSSGQNSTCHGTEDGRMDTLEPGDQQSLGNNKQIFHKGLDTNSDLCKD